MTSAGVTVPGHRKATLRDVSRLAGVSRMTVTRALIRPEQVRPATRARIEEIVAQLGYVPDRAAGGLATRRSGFVGLVLPVLANGNFASLAEGLTEVLRPANYEILIGYTSYSLAEEERQVRAMLARRPEALVLTASAHSDAARQLLAHAALPVIELAELPERPIDRAIGFSNYAVGETAAAFLLRQGGRRLAALGPSRSGDRYDTRGEARLAGFAAGLRAAGMATDLVRRVCPIPLSFEEGAQAMAALLDDVPEVDGVFAISDLCGVGALMECHRRGVSVPTQLSLVGFGDFEIGRQTVPALTTIAVDFSDLGRRAGALIADLLGGAALPRESRIDVGFTLIERGTTMREADGATHGRQRVRRKA